MISDNKRTNITAITNAINYEDKEFGNLKVIKYVNAREVICKCKCGNPELVITRKYKLDNGSVVSCGCLDEHTLNKKKYEAMKNDEFEVIEYVNALNIICKCSCGNTFKTVKQHIDDGLVHSCGCKHHVIDYNKQYGMEKKGYLTIGRHIGYGIYECTCVCGTVCYRSRQQLNTTNKPSCGCKQSESKGMTKDGIALLEKIYNYIITNKGKTINMLADEMKLSRSTVQKAIHKLNLENYVIYNDNVSYPEKELQYFITEELQKYAVYNSRNIISPQELDIYIPEKKIAIEFDGNYWHSDEYKDKNYHRDKSLNCTNKGIRLIHIFEYEWNDDRKKQIIKNIIKGILIDNNKVYARNTVIKEIDTNSYREFCNKYHLQGYAPAEVKIGCFYNNELIGIMSFGKPRFNSEYEYELIRLCWVNEISVIGGTEKLFAYFKNNYEPKSIITYNNISKFTGTVYTRIGFKIIDMTEPSYVWTNYKEALSRYQTQKDKLVKAGLGTEKQTEEEIMRKLQYHRVYDCGNLKLEWKQQ